MVTFGHIRRRLELLPEVQLDELLLGRPVVIIVLLLLVKLLENVVVGVVDVVPAVDFFVHGLVYLFLLFLAVFFFNHGSVLFDMGSFSF